VKRRKRERKRNQELAALIRSFPSAINYEGFYIPLSPAPSVPTGFSIRIGPPWLTRYEKARIIGARALQLSLGAPPLVPVEELGLKDPIEIAALELKLKFLPMVIRRWTLSGDYQDIPLSYLEIR